MLRGYFARQLFYTADTGGGSGASGTTSGGAQTGGEPGTVSTTSAPATGQAPAPASGDTTPAADKPTGDKPAGEKTFSQADVDRIVTERLAEEKRRAEQRTADASKKSKEEALRQAGEWEKLAEERGTELASLQGAAEQRDAFAKALNDVIKEQIADWPEEVRALDPGKDNLEARLVWMRSARPLAERLKQAPKAPSTEAGAGNRKPPENASEAGAGDQKKYRFTTPGDVTW